MTVSVNLNDHIGIDLDNRLGLRLQGEGHDLAGPCIGCKSSDAFRLHQQTGVAHCFSCQGKWSPLQVVETVLADREQAKALLVEMGVFERNETSTAAGDPVEAIARQKGIPPESLKTFGAKVASPTGIRLPAYGPDGKPCTTFTMTVKGGKGRFAKGKKAGLFFPHVEGKVRLPQPGEVWHIVEGPKDAAALHGLELLACGLNTCRLAAKFGRLFTGVEVVLVPDRDRAGEEGSKFSAGVLRGIAKSVRIAVLPADFKESEGEDVRDVLRRPDGREQAVQAIADAQPPDGWDTGDDTSATAVPTIASAEVVLPEGGPLRVQVWPAGPESRRLIVAIRGDIEHRDRINTDSSPSRDRFLKKLAAKLGIERDTLAPLVEAQITKLAGEIDEKTPAPAAYVREEAQSQATQATDMADDWELWHTPSKEGYATVQVTEHKENWMIRSQMFKRYVARQFFENHGKAMNADALGAAVNLFEGKALFDGSEHAVHVRLGEHEGNIYLDLCNANWQVVKITPQGWEIVDESPIYFRRSGGMLALPTPERGGSVELLRPFLNVDENTWRLLLAWLVAALRPRGPYPILAFFAEQGSGKSMAGRLLRQIIDPNAAPLRAEPRNGRDLMIAANNSWCMAFENLSDIPDWLSDAMCRLSTGGGFATRQLFTDTDEVIFDSQRPQLLTSIEDVATRSDLLDRCLITWLPEIPKDRRRGEVQMLEAFERVRPQILGALLDTVVVAIRRLPLIKPPSLPRMADFALWATAAEPAFGWPSGTFMASYQANRDSANDVALEASVVAGPLLELLEAQGEWVGSSGELLKALEGRQGEQARKLKTWPKNARSLTGHLKRLAPNLRAAGWAIDQDRSSRKRWWTIRRGNDGNNDADRSRPSSFASPDERRESMPTDADSCNPEADDANDANDANSGEPWNRDRY